MDKIDEPRRLLEWLSIRIPGNPRSQGTFHIPINRSNFAAYAPLLRMMRVYYSYALWHIIRIQAIYPLLFLLYRSYTLLKCSSCIFYYVRVYIMFYFVKADWHYYIQINISIIKR